MQRAEVERTMRFVVFGHASHEALLAPFLGLCGKALFLPVTEAMLSRIDQGDLFEVDALLARRLTSADFLTCTPRAWQPLPLLGIPGATVENEMLITTPTRGSSACRVQCAREVRQATAERFGVWRKVRAPQGGMPANGRAPRGDRQCNRKIPPKFARTGKGEMVG